MILRLKSSKHSDNIHHRHPIKRRAGARVAFKPLMWVSCLSQGISNPAQNCLRSNEFVLL